MNNSNEHCMNNCNTGITDIYESIALEEAAIAHILNAEGEKIQKALEGNISIEDMLRVNCSVESMIEEVTSLEMTLARKLKYAACVPPMPCLGAIAIHVSDCHTACSIQGAIVAVYNSQELLVISTTTDVNGMATFGKLCCGKYKVVVKFNGIDKVYDVELTCEKPVVNISVCFSQITRKGICISVVTCTCRTPIECAVVAIYKGDLLINEGHTDSTGSYCHYGLESGDYMVHVTYCGQTAQLTASITDTEPVMYLSTCLDIDVPQPISVSLNGMVSSRNGALLSGACVTVRAGGREYSATTNVKGQYSIALPPAADYSVEATCRGARSNSYRVFSTPNRASYSLDIRIG